MDKKRIWRPSSHGNRKDGPISVAEPQHRLGPIEITSGISMRTHPDACIEERELCRLKACWAICTSTSRRHFKIISDEINIYNSNLSTMSKIIQEWEQCFAEPLGNFSSPKTIALRLEEQERQINSLKDSLSKENARYREELKTKTDDFENQLRVCNYSVNNEREHFKSVHSSRSEEFEKQLKGCIMEYQEKIDYLTKFYENKLRTFENVYEGKLKNQREIEQEKEQRLREEINKLEEQLQMSRDSQSREISSLKRKLHELAARRNAPIGVNNHFNDADGEGSAARLDVDPLVDVSLDLKGEGFSDNIVKIRQSDKPKLMTFKKKLTGVTEALNVITREKERLNTSLQKTRLDLARHQNRGDNLQSINDAMREILVMRGSMPCLIHGGYGLESSGTSPASKSVGSCIVEDRVNRWSNSIPEPLELCFYTVTK